MDKGFKIIMITLVILSLVMSWIALFNEEPDYSDVAVAKIKSLYDKECIFICNEAERISINARTEKVVYIVSVYDGTTDGAYWRVEITYNKNTGKVTLINYDRDQFIFD
jgi:hypothetical protein